MTEPETSEAGSAEARRAEPRASEPGPVEPRAAEPRPTEPRSTARDRDVRRALLTGFWLLAVSIPLGVTLEALHGLKVQTYLASEMRREMWRLAHAHGTLLGILCLVFAALAERHVPKTVRRTATTQLTAGAVLMPVGFFVGGILNGEGDPSFGILLVPLGALCLVAALGRVALRIGGES